MKFQLAATSSPVSLASALFLGGVVMVIFGYSPYPWKWITAAGTCCNDTYVRSIGGPVHVHKVDIARERTSSLVPGADRPWPKLESLVPCWTRLCLFFFCPFFFFFPFWVVFPSRQASKQADKLASCCALWFAYSHVPHGVPEMMEWIPPMQRRHRHGSLYLCLSLTLFFFFFWV